MRIFEAYSGKTIKRRICVNLLEMQLKDIIYNQNFTLEF